MAAGVLGSAVMLFIESSSLASASFSVRMLRVEQRKQKKATKRISLQSFLESSHGLGKLEKGGGRSEK